MCTWSLRSPTGSQVIDCTNSGQADVPHSLLRRNMRCRPHLSMRASRCAIPISHINPSTSADICCGEVIAWRSSTRHNQSEGEFSLGRTRRTLEGTMLVGLLPPTRVYGPDHVTSQGCQGLTVICRRHTKFCNMRTPQM